MWKRNRYQHAEPGAEAPGASGTDNGAASADALDSDNDLFADLATHDDYAEPEPIIEGAPPAIAAAEQTPAAASSQVPPTPPSSPPAAASAAPAAQTPGAPSTTEQPTPASAAAPEPQPATGTPEPVDFEKHRATFLPKLEELYKFSDQEAEEIRVEPEKALPKLAARLHYEVLTAAFNSVMSVMPEVVGSTLERQKAVTEHEEKFYSRWKELKDPRYSETVLNSVRAYKAVNPRAPLEEVIERAGLMAMLTLGINPQQPAAPVAPVEPPAVRPGRPAGAGFGSAPFQTNSSGSAEVDDIQALIAAEMAGQI
jgi:hypothetical protein